MTHEVASGLYEGNFSHWLQKRFAFSPHITRPRKHAPKRYARVNIATYLLSEFDPKTLARLNALGLAT
ncbi:MAG: hypothetical protein OEM91_09935 [Hyphomicrobiales bacterium]|nr:hypothetical protein [Hyphomicrobiales bacterium]